MIYISHIIHTYTYSLVWCVYRTRRSSPLCTKLDPLSWNEHVLLLNSCSFIMIEVHHYFQSVSMLGVSVDSLASDCFFLLVTCLPI